MSDDLVENEKPTDEPRRRTESARQPWEGDGAVAHCRFERRDRAQRGDGLAIQGLPLQECVALVGTGQSRVGNLLLAAFLQSTTVGSLDTYGGGMAPRILVVDDEPAVRAIVTRALEADGYDVVAASDGVAGLEATRCGPFDLVVTDDAMPRMSGSEMTTCLQQTCPHMPILHISGRRGDTSPSDRYHLYKPFGLDELQHAVRTLLVSKVVEQSGSPSPTLPATPVARSCSSSVFVG